ncbi:MAG TPA: ATP-binding cassette domain-containing protein, partial [Orrella sp.]
MIEFQHVSKSYGPNAHILEDVSFQVTAGEFLFIAGPSGAGKSTLLKLIAGLNK